MIEARIRYATTDGADIAFATHGHGPHLLFAGALPFCHAEQCVTFNAQLFEPLADAFQLAWFDFRGCGLSQREGASFSLDELQGDIGAVADALGWQAFHLLGRNAGAMGAIAFASAHPRRVLSLIAVEAWLGDVPANTPFRRVSAGLQNAHWDEFTELLSLASLRFMERERAPRLAAYMRACVDQQGFLQSQEAAEAYNIEPALKGLTCPTLFVDRPPEGREYEAKKLAARTPGATVQFADDPIYAILPAIVSSFCGPYGASSSPPEPVAGRAASFLSAREIEVLRLLAAGHTNGSIGTELFISTFTVNRHVSHIYEKLGVSNRAEAATWAAHHGTE